MTAAAEAWVAVNCARCGHRQYRHAYAMGICHLDCGCKAYEEGEQ